METPTITVVTPTLNAACTLRRCIDSLLIQTLQPAEHIVVDGFSTDGTIELLDALRAASPTLRVFVAKDRGVFDAMNHALDVATSDWIYFLGADDELVDAGVIQDVAPLLGDDAELVYGDVILGESGVVGGVFDLERLANENICHQAIFYHRRVFERMGKFSLQYPLMADYVFNIRCFASGLRTKHTPRVIARYSNTGVSSRLTDAAFLRDRLAIVLKHLGPLLPRERLTPHFHDQIRALLCEDGLARGLYRVARLILRTGYFPLLRDLPYHIRACLRDDSAG